MKQILPILVLAVLLSGCSLINTPTAIPEDSEMATRVAQILTSMPTATSQTGGQIPSPVLPTIISSPTTGLVETATSVTTATSAPSATPLVMPTIAPSATATIAPTGQPASTYIPPASDPTTRLGGPDWSDTMDNSNYWPTGADQFTDIAFSGGAMQLTGLSTTDGWRMTFPEETNFYLEAIFQVSDCSGDDRYGVIARVPQLNSPDRGYLFGFTCDGKYSLRRWNASVGANGEMVNLVEWKTSTAVNAGSSQTNRLGLMAIGDRLVLYANGQQLTEVRDSTFATGYFGMFVGARETDKFTIRVDQVRVWENPEQ
ncbi:MAG: hypothetical protein ACYC36_09185 [Bellilinea sp.]